MPSLKLQMAIILWLNEHKVKKRQALGELCSSEGKAWRSFVVGRMLGPCFKRPFSISLSWTSVISSDQYWFGQNASCGSVFCNIWRKTAPQLAFSVLGASYVSGHCAIEDRPWRRALSRQAGREDWRWVICKLLCGEKQVDGEIFIFECTCPLNMHTCSRLPR